MKHKRRRKRKVPKTPGRRSMGVQTVHTTISVPRKIRKRMDKFQDANPTNWSQLATLAFKNHMDEVEGDGVLT